MQSGEEDQRFRRDVIEGSQLQYVRRMKYFYESQFNELSNMLGEETEFGVLITEKMLEKIEERLSDFEKKEKKLVDNYRKCIRETEGVAV